MLLAFTGWLGFQAMGVKTNLEQAQSDAREVKEALIEGKSEDAARWAKAAQDHTREARATTDGFPWRIASSIPFLGSPLKTTQQIANLATGLADKILVPASRAATAISPEALIDGSRINLQLLQSEQPRLSELSAAAAKIDAEARLISKPAFISQIIRARTQLQDQTALLARTLENASLAAQLAPPMLGIDGPRKYLMAFQTGSEARGTGGLAGAFAVLTFDKGAPSLDTLTTNLELHGASADIDLGPEFNNVYGYTNPYGDFRNSNMSAHFPNAAQIWRSMWQQRSGANVDGVIALDPTALSYILGALGPVTMPDGEKVTQENVVQLTQNTVYIRFPEQTDQQARKEYLQTIAREIAKKATGAIPSPRTLLEAIGRAADGGHLSVWSSSPTDQKLLEETPLAHTIPTDDAPYAQIVINNLSGTKMDYYLKREIEYEADGCTSERRNSTVNVKLSNTGEATSLPPFYSETVTWPNQSAGGPVLNHQFRIQVPRGTMISSVRLIATNGAQLISVTSNGKRTSAIVNTERGHPTFEVQLAIPPGQTAELSFRLSEPTASGTPRTPVQPLIDDVEPVMSVPTCP